MTNGKALTGGKKAQRADIFVEKVKNWVQSRGDIFDILRCHRYAALTKLHNLYYKDVGATHLKNETKFVFVDKH
jgi:hypothetical protein